MIWTKFHRHAVVSSPVLRHTQHHLDPTSGGDRHARPCWIWRYLRGKWIPESHPMSAVRRGSPPPAETPGGSHRGAWYAQFPKINIDHGDTWRLQLINYRSLCEVHWAYSKRIEWFSTSIVISAQDSSPYPCCPLAVCLSCHGTSMKFGIWMYLVEPWKIVDIWLRACTSSPLHNGNGHFAGNLHIWLKKNYVVLPIVQRILAQWVIYYHILSYVYICIYLQLTVSNIFQHSPRTLRTSSWLGGRSCWPSASCFSNVCRKSSAPVVGCRSNWSQLYAAGTEAPQAGHWMNILKILKDKKNIWRKHLLLEPNECPKCRNLYFRLSASNLECSTTYPCVAF